MKQLIALLAVLSISCAHLQQKPSNYSHVAAKVFAEFIDDADRAMSGTAFLYRGHLITAGHVCAGWSALDILGLVGSLELKFVNREGTGFRRVGFYTPDRVMYNETTDVCILKHYSGDYVPPELVELRAASGVRIGDPVAVIGAPYGFSLYRTDGYVASLRDPAFRGLMGISAAVMGGNSGSPVLDIDGHLVGVLVAGIVSYHHISVVVPVKQIDELIDLVE